MHLEKGLQYPIGPLGSVIVVVSCIMLSPHSCGLLLLKLELLLLQLSSYVGGGSCVKSQVLYSGGSMRGQDVGTGVTFPSVKKGMVDPVDTQNRGAEVSSARRWLGGKAAPGA